MLKMKTINNILKKDDSNLKKLIKKALSSENLSHVFKTSVDQNLAKYCQFANYKKSTLTLIVTNSSWATKLRFAIPDIIKTLQVNPEFNDISKIKYVIAPNELKTARKSKTIKLTGENEKLWKKTVNELKEKAALRK